LLWRVGSGLLNRVRQFLRQQLPSFDTSRGIPLVVERDGLPNFVRHRGDGLGGSFGVWVSMYANLAEIVSRALVEERSGLCVEQASRRGQDIATDGR
jgi:hypothetical protein